MNFVELTDLPYNSRFYLKAIENKCYGYLLICDDALERDKVSLLEFYIFEPYQRFGHGKVIFTLYV